MPLVKQKGTAWPSEETNLWRYMDLARFASLLQKAALFFPSVGTLAQTDPYEGRLPYRQAVQLARPEAWKLTDLGNVGPDFTAEQGAKIIADVARQFVPHTEGIALFHTFVSCWHANNGESDAMWRLYSLQGQGIAVRSTFKRLREALHGDTKKIYAGRVKYLDYDWHGIDLEENLNLVFHKRNSFAHEQEVRFAYQVPEEERQAIQPRGISVPVDLKAVIEGILVSPGTAKWVVDVVAGLVQRYGLDAGLVSQSPLYEPRAELSTPPTTIPPSS